MKHCVGMGEVSCEDGPCCLLVFLLLVFGAVRRTKPSGRLEQSCTML